jgi:Skp family chaperone for outer membrane proteins
MTKTFMPALFAAAAVAAFAAPAIAASDPAVLVVDFNRVFSESAAAKSGTSQLQAKYNATLQQRRSAFQSAAQAYNSQVESARKVAKPGADLPPATQQALQQAGQRAQAAQQQLQDLQEDVNESASYVRQQIIERSTPIAEQIRGEHKAAVVVDKGQTLASDPADDVTSVLIQRLDAAFTAPSITPPQPAQGAAPSTAQPATRATPQGR